MVDEKAHIYIEQSIGSLYLLDDEGTPPNKRSHTRNNNQVVNQPPMLPMPSPPAAAT